MNTVTITPPSSAPMQIKSHPDAPKKMEQSAGFQAAIDVEIHSAQNSPGCEGVANVIDMDAFFAAWGSTDSEYDMDANGIVDGADLTILLAGQSDQPMPGSVDDVLQQWGVQGESTADLNADGIVDGADLMLALAGTPSDEPAQGGSESQQEDIESDLPTRLVDLLADWGTDAARSDYTGDGIVDGLDLSFLLGGNVSDNNGQQGAMEHPEAFDLPTFTNESPQNIIDPLATFRMESAVASTKDFSGRIFDQLQSRGFESQPPRNLDKLVDAFKLNPIQSKAVMSNIADLFGGDDRKDVGRG